MPSLVRTSLLAFLLWPLLTLELGGQATATLEGVIRSQSGAPIAGAILRFDQAADSARSDAGGRFALRSAAGRTGTLLVRADGHSPLSLVVPALAPGERRVVGLTLTPLYVLDALTVVAPRRRPLLNASDAATGGAVETAELEALPVEGRNPLRLLFNVPGVATGTGFFGDAPLLSFNGHNPLYTQYTLDGLDNNEGFLGGPRVEFPLAGVSRMEALVNSYGAEFGRSLSGVVNQLSRAGANETRGEFLLVSRPGRPFDALNTVPFGISDTALFRRQQEGFTRFQAGGALSGPLVRDRTFAAGAVEYTRETEDRVTSTARTAFVGTENRETVKLFGRLDHGWTPTQTTTLRAAASHVNRAGLGGGILTPEADITTRRVGSLTALTHRSTWSNGRASNTASLQVGTFRWYFPPSASDFSRPQVTVLDSATAAPLAIVGSSNFIFDESEFQLQLREVLEFRHGERHTFRAGADMVRSWFTLTGSNTNPNGAYAVWNDPGNPITAAGPTLTLADVPDNVRVASYTIDANPAQVDLAQTTVGAFVEDRWRVSPTMSLVLGLRWDYDDITSRGESTPDLNNVQPRVALNWLRTPRSVLRAGIGRYAGKFPYAIFSDAVQFGPEGNATVSFDSTTAVRPPALGQGLTAEDLRRERSILPPREVRRMFALGLRQPMTTQATLGYQVQLGDHWGITVDGVVSETRNLPRSHDLNPVDYQLSPADTSAAAAKTTIFGDDLRLQYPIRDSFRRLTTTETAGRARYTALYVSVRRQLADRWTVDANWVWSRARNDTEDINFAAAVANDFDAEWADAINDRRHRVSIRAAHLGDRLRLSVIGDFQTGLPVNRVAGTLNPDGSAVLHDLDGSGPIFGPGFVGNHDRFFGVPRNGERLPSHLNVSASAGYVVPVGGGRLELRAELFNLLDRTEWGNHANGITGGGSRTQFGQPGDPIVLRSPGPPRQVQFSLRHAF